MYQLVILSVFDKLAGLPDRLVEFPLEFDTSSQAELRALRWLTYRPNDIVMLLEPAEVPA